MLPANINSGAVENTSHGGREQMVCDSMQHSPAAAQECEPGIYCTSRGCCRVHVLFSFSQQFSLHLPSPPNDEGWGRRLWTPPISLTKLNKCSSDLSHDLQGFSSARRNRKEKQNAYNIVDMFARSRLLTWERAWQSHYC